MILEGYIHEPVVSMSPYVDLLTRLRGSQVARMHESRAAMYWVGELVAWKGKTYRVAAVTRPEDWFSEDVFLHLERPWLRSTPTKVVWLEDAFFPRAVTS